MSFCCQSLFKRKRKNNSFLKVVSVLLLSAFFFQEISFANPDLRPISRDAKPKVDLGIPQTIATIEDAWFSREEKPKTIFLIQDAHTNFSGQLNVAKTLDHLLSSRPRPKAERRDLSFRSLDSARDDMRYVFLEAGSGDESLSFLRQYADPAARKRIAKSFLRQGKLQGSEMADLTTDHDLVLWGVEDLSLYAQSVETYRGIAKERDKFENYMGRMESAISVLKPKIYNPFLLSFDEKYRRFRKEEISFTEYFEILLTEADRLGIRLKTYPHLRFLGKIKKLESVKRLKAKETLKEQKLLEKEVFKSLAATPDEKSLLQASNYLECLKKLLKLTLTPDEFEEYLKDRKSFDVTRITGFLNKKIMDLETHYDRAVFLEAGYEDVVQKAGEFYQLTFSRDQKFVENTLKKMDQENQTQAVLITGGYHTPNLKVLLKQQNVSYICLTPQILHETNWKRYETLLFEQNRSFLKSSAAPVHHPLSMNQLPQIVQRFKNGDVRDPDALARAFKPGTTFKTLSAARLAGKTVASLEPRVVSEQPITLDPSLATNHAARLALSERSESKGLAESYSIEWPSFESTINLPRIFSIDNSINRVSSAFSMSALTIGWIFMTIIPQVLEAGYRALSVKSWSWVRKILLSSIDFLNKSPFLSPLRSTMASIPSFFREATSLWLTSSSTRSRTEEKSGNEGIFRVLQGLSGEMERGLDVLQRQSWVIFQYLFGRLTRFQKLQHDIDRHTGPNKTSLPVMDIPIILNVLIDFLTHSQIIAQNPTQRNSPYLSPAARLALSERSESKGLAESNRREFFPQAGAWVRAIYAVVKNPIGLIGATVRERFGRRSLDKAMVQAVDASIGLTLQLFSERDSEAEINRFVNLSRDSQNQEIIHFEHDWRSYLYKRSLEDKKPYDEVVFNQFLGGLRYRADQTGKWLNHASAETGGLLQLESEIHDPGYITLDYVNFEEGDPESGNSLIGMWIRLYRKWVEMASLDENHPQYKHLASFRRDQSVYQAHIEALRRFYALPAADQRRLMVRLLQNRQAVTSPILQRADSVAKDICQNMAPRWEEKLRKIDSAQSEAIERQRARLETLVPRVPKGSVFIGFEKRAGGLYFIDDWKLVEEAVKRHPEWGIRLIRDERDPTSRDLLPRVLDIMDKLTKDAPTTYRDQETVGIAMGIGSKEGAFALYDDLWSSVFSTNHPHLFWGALYIPYDSVRFPWEREHSASSFGSFTDLFVAWATQSQIPAGVYAVEPGFVLSPQSKELFLVEILQNKLNSPNGGRLAGKTVASLEPRVVSEQPITLDPSLATNHAARLALSERSESKGLAEEEADFWGPFFKAMNVRHYQFLAEGLPSFKPKLNPWNERSPNAFAVYAGSGYDVEGMRQILNEFPQIKTLILVDPEYGGKGMVSKSFTGFGELIFLKMIYEPLLLKYELAVHQEDSPSIYKGALYYLKGSFLDRRMNPRPIELVFYGEDYLAPDTPQFILKDHGGFGVSFAKKSGINNQMWSWPHREEGAEFYQKLIQETHPNGLISISDMHVPPDLVLKAHPLNVLYDSRLPKGSWLSQWFRRPTLFGNPKRLDSEDFLLLQKTSAARLAGKNQVNGGRLKVEAIQTDRELNGEFGLSLASKGYFLRQNPESSSTTSLPRSVFADSSLRALVKMGMTWLGYGGWTLITIMPLVFLGGYMLVFKKSLSPVSNILLDSMAALYTVPFLVLLGVKVTSWLLVWRKEAISLWRFSSTSILNLGKRYKLFALDALARITNRGTDGFFGQSGIPAQDIGSTHPTLQETKDGSHGDASPFENGSPMTETWVNADTAIHNRFHDFSDTQEKYSTIYPDGQIYAASAARLAGAPSVQLEVRSWKLKEKTKGEKDAISEAEGSNFSLTAPLSPTPFHFNMQSGKDLTPLLVLDPLMFVRKVNHNNIEDITRSESSQWHLSAARLALSERSESKGLADQPSTDSADAFRLYLKEHGLDRYSSLHGLFSEEIRKELLGSPSLKPVFLVAIPKGRLRGIITPSHIDLSRTIVAGIPVKDLFEKYSLFKAESPAAANRMARRGGFRIHVGVTDRDGRHGELDRLGANNWRVANGRRVYFSLPDGTWLSVLGSGQNQEDAKEPYYLNESGDDDVQGMATLSEARRALAAANLFHGRKVRFTQFLGYRRFDALYRRTGVLEKVDKIRSPNEELIHPTLIFERVIHPHRFSKLPQLLRTDPGLKKLLTQISSTLSRSGYLETGHVLTLGEWWDMIVREMAIQEAVKQNAGQSKLTLHSQDITMAGEEADLQEMANANDTIAYLDSQTDLKQLSKHHVQNLKEFGIATNGLSGKINLIEGVTLWKWYVMGNWDFRSSVSKMMPSTRNSLMQFFIYYFKNLNLKSLSHWTHSKVWAQNSDLVVTGPVRSLDRYALARLYYDEGDSMAWDEALRRQKAAIQAIIDLAKDIRRDRALAKRSSDRSLLKGARLAGKSAALRTFILELLDAQGERAARGRSLALKDTGILAFHSTGKGIEVSIEGSQTRIVFRDVHKALKAHRLRRARRHQETEALTAQGALQTIRGAIQANRSLIEGALTVDTAIEVPIEGLAGVKDRLKFDGALSAAIVQAVDLRNSVPLGSQRKLSYHLIGIEDLEPWQLERLKALVKPLPFIHLGKAESAFRGLIVTLEDIEGDAQIARRANQITLPAGGIHETHNALSWIKALMESYALGVFYGGHFDIENATINDAGVKTAGGVPENIVQYHDRFAQARGLKGGTFAAILRRVPGKKGLFRRYAFFLPSLGPLNLWEKISGKLLRAISAAA